MIWISMGIYNQLDKNWKRMVLAVCWTCTRQVDVRLDVHLQLGIYLPTCMHSYAMRCDAMPSFFRYREICNGMHIDMPDTPDLANRTCHTCRIFCLHARTIPTILQVPTFYSACYFRFSTCYCPTCYFPRISCNLLLLDTYCFLLPSCHPRYPTSHDQIQGKT